MAYERNKIVRALPDGESTYAEFVGEDVVDLIKTEDDKVP